MKSSLIASIALVLVNLLCTATIGSAATIRGSSGNGEGNDAASWLLVGRTNVVKLGGNGKAATVSREVVCLNQTVENALPNPDPGLSGSCYDGVYMYLLQVQAQSAQVEVIISGLVGFDYQNNATYGVIVCDDENTMELCTSAPAANIPEITSRAMETSVSFAVAGRFPSYPEGTEQEGRGLTFFVITNQASPLPIALPEIRIR